jgi:hypothetical protein
MARRPAGGARAGAGRRERRGGSAAGCHPRFGFFVDLAARAASGGAPTLFGLVWRHPEAGEALPRFGLDIGRGPSGCKEGADAVRGHDNFFLRGPLFSIIRLGGCLPESRRTRPPRPPDARSFKVAAREMAGAFPTRSCEATVHEIAHRVKPDGVLRLAAKDHGGSRKKCGWPPAALPSVRRSRRLQGSLVPPAATGVRDTVLRVVSSPPADARCATRSTMNRFFGRHSRRRSAAGAGVHDIRRAIRRIFGHANGWMDGRSGGRCRLPS